MSNPRLRELGIIIRAYQPGPFNAITDVEGILVGHTALSHNAPRVARTDVTVIVPRNGDIWRDNCSAGFHSFNGCGKMAGVHWIKEIGMLCSPIALTRTHLIGAAHKALVPHGAERAQRYIGALPVCAETWGRWPSDPTRIT